MFSKLDLHSLQNPEFIAFFKSLLGFISGNATVSAAVAARAATLSAIITRIDELFKNDPASALTAKLQGYDAERDSCISGIAKVCDGYGSHPDPAMREAASVLLRSITVYGGATAINDLGVQAETATVESLVSDWTNKHDLSAAISTLGFGSWLAALRTANENYSTTSDSRTSEAAAARTPDKIRGKREEAIKEWNDELSMDIASYQRLAPATTKADWDKVADEISTLIGQTKNTLAARSGRAAANKKKKDGGNEGETPQ